MCIVVLSAKHTCMQTQAQLIEDWSEGLAGSHRRLEAARENLIKEAARVLEGKANLRSQQEAINLLQVGLSHTYTTVSC